MRTNGQGNGTEMHFTQGYTNFLIWRRTPTTYIGSFNRVTTATTGKQSGQSSWHFKTPIRTLSPVGEVTSVTIILGKFGSTTQKPTRRSQQSSSKESRSLTQQDTSSTLDSKKTRKSTKRARRSPRTNTSPNVSEQNTSETEAS